MTLIGYWPLNEESGDTAYDYSGNENHGSLEGSPTQEVKGILGSNAYEFDGENDYVDTFAPTLDLSNTFTLVFWFNSRVEAPGRPFGNFNTYGSGHIEIESREDYTIGGFRFRYGANGSGHVIGTPYVNDQKWHQIVWVHNGWDGSHHNYRIFVDGVLYDTESWDEEKYSETTLRMGDEEDQDSYYGALSEVRLYNRALTASEVQYLYNVSKRGKFTSHKKKL